MATAVGTVVGYTVDASARIGCVVGASQVVWLVLRQPFWCSRHAQKLAREYSPTRPS